MQIGLADVIIKMILYYIHERFWFKLPIAQSNKRHILKTVTWRIIGTLSTIILAIWIWGDSIQSLQIGGAETITKSLLYYFHEKFWYRLQFGLDNKRQKRRDSVQ